MRLSGRVQFPRRTLVALEDSEMVTEDAVGTKLLFCDGTGSVSGTRSGTSTLFLSLLHVLFTLLRAVAVEVESADGIS